MVTSLYFWFNYSSDATLHAVRCVQVLVYALRASLQELLMLFIFLLIAMLVFATMIYYAERKDATK